MTNRHIIIGTAGHIDHGKSTLVKALTGMDPDRLAEEKERGLTIDIGFAFYGDRAAFIDVPGHEKFIKNMVAGVTTIDMAILLVAADDGVMPQTREHLDILNILGIPRGFVVITKVDLVDEEWIELVEEDVKNLVKGTFLEEAPILKFSAVTNEGLDDIKKTLDEFLAVPPPKRDRGFFWMPIDRSFTIRGFGTVVTGSVLSGRLRAGETVEILPHRRLLKVRGLQKHEHPAEEVEIGDRAAVNLAGIAKDEIERGNVLASPHYGIPTKRIDAKFQLLKNAPKELANQTRVRFHVGTSEIFARIRLLNSDVLYPGQSDYCQLFFEQEIALNRLDRFVVRQYSPQVTIGGGIVLDSHPRLRHKRFSEPVLRHLQKLESSDPKEVLMEFIQMYRFPRILEEIAYGAGMDFSQTQQMIRLLEKENKIQQIHVGTKDYILSNETIDYYSKRIPELIEYYHKTHPIEPGIPKAELHHKFNAALEDSVFQTILAHLEQKDLLVVDNDRVRLKSFLWDLDSQLSQKYEAFLSKLTKDAFQTMRPEEYAQFLSIQENTLNNLIQYGKKKGQLIVLPGNIVFSYRCVEEAKKRLLAYFETHSEIRLSDFRNLLNTTRKFALPLMEYFDAQEVTERIGDVRVPGVNLKK
ncbi:MAG: selenocysteine-specific translation elongation factor [Calditrichaeota bacterium]|nr:selenocysteine-specific translation elongation factor [Calditrichota bacterium]